MKKSMALCAALLLLVAACASGTTAAPGGAVTAPHPRLLVFIAIDGLPQWQVEAYREQLAPDGFRRFLDRGTWFAQAYYRDANTLTAPGHATMLTGAYPDRTGIIANEWIDPSTRTIEYCTGDREATYIGHATGKLAGTSPKNLRVETLGDVVKRADASSKVIAIAGKDRGAILLAGKTGVAYMYQPDSGEFTSSTFYMKRHPAWVDEFNARKPADAYFHREWKALLPDAAYASSVPDAQPWFAPGGKLPMAMGATMKEPGRRFYGELLRSPFGDELVMAFARAAIRGEHLGEDRATDILALGLSGHDYVNHSFSAESRLSHDHFLQLDRMLEAFFRDLDAAVGKDGYVAVLTADHGFMPAPEYSLAKGRDAGRADAVRMMRAVNVELRRKFGDGIWALALSAQGLLLNHPLAAQRNVPLQDLEQETRRILLLQPGIAAVFTRSELQSGPRPADALFEQVRKSFDRERSPDLEIVLKPYWMFGSVAGHGTTHGSPHDYDTHVPILMYGPRWIGTGRVDARVEVVDIAPTLAKMLGVPAPSASEGKVLDVGAATR